MALRCSSNAIFLSRTGTFGEPVIIQSYRNGQNLASSGFVIQNVSMLNAGIYTCTELVQTNKTQRHVFQLLVYGKLYHLNLYILQILCKRMLCIVFAQCILVFLVHDSMLSALYAIANPSVCPSVTRVDQSKTVERIIEILSPSDRPNILVF